MVRGLSFPLLLLSAALVVLSSGAASGAIVENTNGRGITYYYAVSNGKVFIKQCPGDPSSDIDPAHCQDIPPSVYFDPTPFAIADFQARVRAWGKHDLEKLTQSIAATQVELDQAKKQLDEINRLIQGLPSDSPALSDYRDRRDDTLKKMQSLGNTIAHDKDQLGGFDLLFGKDGYLFQDLIHPIRKGESTYLSVRPFVRHFYEVFKYPGVTDPEKPIEEARADFARSAAGNMKPYCAYWNSGYGSGTDSWVDTTIRILVTLNRSETFYRAQASCKALGMTLPAAEHIPAYHSHLFWGNDDSSETWPRQKSVSLFAASALAKSLPNSSYVGRTLKIFWETPNWTPRPSDIDAFFMTPSGDWFDYQSDNNVPGPYVNPNWALSVVCEKEYRMIPRYLDNGELTACTEYEGWP